MRVSNWASSNENGPPCVSYAAHGGTLTVKTQTQLDCESFGGTFALGGTYTLGTSVWTCQWPTTDLTDYTTKSGTLNTDCLTLAPTGTAFYGNDTLTPVVPGTNKSVCAP